MSSSNSSWHTKPLCLDGTCVYVNSKEEPVFGGKIFYYAHHFSQNGLEVTGVDASEEAISHLNQYNRKNSMFVCDDFVTCKALYQAQYDYFYSRWTMHAISERQEDELLRNISSSIKKDGLLFIEARSIHDDLYGVGEKISENEYIYNDHYRRFMDKDIFINKLKKLGYEIVFEVEGNTLSKTKKSDPTLIRIVAKYIG